MEALQNITITYFPRLSSATSELRLPWNAWTVVPTILLLVIGFFLTMGGVFSKNHMPVDGKTILLTGASEGMGCSLAKLLASRGANLVLVSRNVGKLEEAVAAAQAVAIHPNQRFTYVATDVSKEGFAEPLLAKATAWNGGRVPDIVWCVAGMSIPGLFASQDLETLRRQTNLNFFGQAELAHAAIRAWLQEGSGLSDGAAAISNGHLSETSNSQSNGHASTAALTPTKANAPLPKRHLIFTSSTAAFYTIVGYASYSPSKWALRGLCDTLAQDTMLYKAAGLADIRVATVFPGTMTSPGFERENETKPAITLELERDDPRQHPDQAARDALRGLEKGKYQVCIGWLGFLMRWGVIGGVERNNWLVDIVMAFVVSVAWMYVQWDQNSRIRAHGRKEGRALLPEGIGAGKGP